jgi:hypothetical protein
MIDYKPGDMYNIGWKDRLEGRPARPGNCPEILIEEYNSGYRDCHRQILDNAKLKNNMISPLEGHPFYKEANEHKGQVFLSD